MKDETISIKALLCFVAVAEHKNFTRAARSLCVTQPIASFHIDALESGLGLELLKRDSRRNRRTAELTEHGYRMLDYAARIVELLTAMKVEAQSIASKEQELANLKQEESE